MNVFMSGASGVLGRRLVPMLKARGHRVVALARSPERAALVRSLGGVPVHADLFDADALARAADGADVVVHAATSIPSGLAARSRRAWAVNDRIRCEGTVAMTAAAARVGAKRFLQHSVAWMVRSRGARRFYNESTVPDPPALLRSAVEGERIAQEAGDRHGFAVGVLRGGAFYGPETSSRDMAALLLRRRMPVVGRGEFRVAPIHVEDMARAFAAAVEADAQGTWNVVDDEPVPFARLLRHLAKAVGAPPPRHIPVWLARVVMGGAAVESLTTGMNTSNARIRRELRWAPAWPTYREGIAGMVQAWRREGFLAPAAAPARARTPALSARNP